MLGLWSSQQWTKLNLNSFNVPLSSNTSVTSNECDVTLAILPDGEATQGVHAPDAIDVKTSATTNAQMSMANEKQITGTIKNNYRKRV